VKSVDKFFYSFTITESFGKMKKIYLFGLVLFILNIYCAGTKRAEFSIPQQIAVLPTINHTTDVMGGLVFRHLFFLELEDRYPMLLIPLEQVNERLNEEGITDGGQLNAVEEQELFQILQADGLLYIDLLACDYQTLGISETRRVKVHFVLITPPAKKMWDFEHEVDEGKSAFDTFFSILGNPKEGLKETAKDLGEQLAQKGGRMWLLDHALKPEMEMVIEEAMDSLPKD